MSLMRSGSKSWRFLLLWVLATITAAAIGAELVTRLLLSAFGQQVRTLVVPGVVIAALVAVAQALILRRQGIPVLGWMLTTFVGIGLVVALAALLMAQVQPGGVTEVDEQGNVVRTWNPEEVERGTTGAIRALIADGALAHSSRASGTVVVGRLSSGVAVGSFDMAGIRIIVEAG